MGKEIFWGHISALRRFLLFGFICYQGSSVVYEWNKIYSLCLLIFKQLHHAFGVILIQKYYNTELKESDTRSLSVKIFSFVVGSVPNSACSLYALIPRCFTKSGDMKEEGRESGRKSPIINQNGLITTHFREKKK